MNRALEYAITTALALGLAMLLVVPIVDKVAQSIIESATFIERH
jgi:hypothetical protein